MGQLGTFLPPSFTGDEKKPVPEIYWNQLETLYNNNNNNNNNEEEEEEEGKKEGKGR